MLDFLDQTPVVADIHPISCSFLPEDTLIYDSLAELVYALDSPEPTLPERILVTTTDSQYQHRFPFMRCEHDPFTTELNTVLYDCYDFIEQHMFTQRSIGQRIISEARDYDVVTLFLVDGLSYQDVSRWRAGGLLAKVEPCLVNGPTKTVIGFRNIIGDPPIAARLFDLGFQHRLGFTHWYREDNVLTDNLFRTISHTEKVGHFSQVLDNLHRCFRTAKWQKMYVQILLTGLDGYAHGQKRKPPVDDIVDDILKEFISVAKLFQELGLSACLYLTADHGILWRDEFEPEVIGNAPGKASPRCAEWSELYQQRETGKRFKLHGEELYCLNYPKVRRPLHIDDQGVHGGISFQESIVPFITLEVEPDA